MYRKKLIEVALPLEAINKASAREKSIRHGHPSTLHLWWARRPLAAARAVIFAQMVDDPSSYVDVLRADPKLRRKAETELRARLKLWEEAKTLAEKAKGTTLSVPESGPAPTLDDMLADLERQRLFKIIEDLVLWENTTNETVLQAARDEIWQSWRRACADNADHPRARELFDRQKLPAFHDPFAGGGALPLEAQRLGLESYASDLNPVAVLINKAMIEIPPRFAGQAPVNPDAQKQRAQMDRRWCGAQGLAEDVRHYGQWMRDEAAKRIGHLRRGDIAPVDLPQAGIVASKGGRVRLLKREELAADWDPSTAPRLKVRKTVHQLIRALESGGEGAAATLVAKLGAKGEVARELCYRLYTLCERKKRAAGALSYNALVKSWPEIARMAQQGSSAARRDRAQLFEEDL